MAVYIRPSDQEHLVSSVKIGNANCSLEVGNVAWSNLLSPGMFLWAFVPYVCKNKPFDAALCRNEPFVLEVTECRVEGTHN